MSEPMTHVHALRLDHRGGIIIPSDVLDALGIAPGDLVSSWIEGDRLVIRSRRVIEDELHAMFRAAGGSMADELIAERRAEAAREELEG